MRLVLLIAVIALVVDALNHDGAYTKAAYRHLMVATEQLRDRFADTEPDSSASRDSQSSTDTTRL